MSLSISVDTTKLNQIIAKLPNNRDKIIRESAEHILFVSKQTTAYKNVSGHLRERNNVNLKYAGYAIVEYYQEYAPYVEFGTWKMPARPFLKPAVEAEEKLLTQRIKDGLIQK